MIVDNFVSLGLSEKEAKTYLMLLRMGPSPASALAKRLLFKRVTVYSVLDSLNSRGLVSYVDCNGTRRYRPHDPDCLLDVLNEKKIALKHKFKLAEECIDELRKFTKRSELNKKPFLEYTSFKLFKESLLKYNSANKLILIFGSFFPSEIADSMKNFFKSNDFSFKSKELWVQSEYFSLSERRSWSSNFQVHCLEKQFPENICFIQLGTSCFYIRSEANSTQYFQVNDKLFIKVLKTYYSKSISLC